MPISDHPSTQTDLARAREAVLASAVAYRTVTRPDEPAGFEQIRFVENLLAAAVDRYVDVASDRSIPARMREAWRGPGFYRLTVSDPDGATSGLVAAGSVDDLILSVGSMLPEQPDPETSVAAAFDSKTGGVDR